METNHKEFKPFDKVIFKYKNKSYIWVCGFFSNYEDGDIYLIGNDVAFSLDEYDILPYEGNEHLVGTTDDPEEEVKLGECEYVLGIYFDARWHPHLKDPFLFGKVKGLIKLVDCEYFDFGVFNLMYVVRLSEFNPNDMEETAKHILCVKNGKVVRYKPE